MNKNIRYSQQKALNQGECELPRYGGRKVDCNRFKFESQSIAFPGGRVGLDPGEITHIYENWINWRKCCIRILLNDPCRQGRESGPCNLCRQFIHQRVESHDTSFGEARIKTAELVQLIGDLQEPVLLLIPKTERFAQEAGL